VPHRAADCPREASGLEGEPEQRSQGYGRATLAMSAELPMLGVHVPSGGVVVGVEIAQGVDDPEPVAIACVRSPWVDPSLPRSASSAPQ
jgi:hypothetical protein